MSHKQDKKTSYYLHKDKDPDDLREAKEFFEDPQQFLNLDSNIVVGITPFKVNRPSEKVKSKSHELEENKENTKEKERKSFSKKADKCEENDKNPEKNRGNFINEIIQALNESTNYNTNTDGEKNKRERKDNRIFSAKTCFNQRPHTGISKLSSENKHRSNNCELPASEKDKCSPKHRVMTATPKKLMDVHYELKSRSELNNIFKDGKKREKEFISKGTDILIPEKISEKQKELFYKQQKLLERNRLNRIQSAKTSRVLSKICGKKESDLLINKVEEYRLKRQMAELLENKKTLHEKFGPNAWYFSLRRPKTLTELRINYVNIGGKDREIWEQVFDHPDVPTEIIKDPFNKNKSVLKNNINKNDYYKKESKKLRLNVPNLENILQLQVKGFNLNKKEQELANNFIKNQHLHGMKVFNDPHEKRSSLTKEYTAKINYEKYKENYKRPLSYHQCKLKQKVERPKFRTEFPNFDERIFLG